MTILVTGATASVGRHVVDELLKRGSDVRALTVDPERAALPPGVEVVRGSVRRPDALTAAFADVAAMYLAPYEPTVAAVVTAARAAGIGHIVDLSGGPDTDWLPIADAVEAVDGDWTHLWPGEFMENTTIWAEQIRSTGHVRDAYADAANAMIAMRDVAAAAAAALTEDGHRMQTLELTGPEKLTRAQTVEQIGTALGRTINFEEVSRDEAIAQLTPSMGEYAAWYVDGKAPLVDDPQEATIALEQIIGRPTTFAQWARTHRDLFS